MKTMDSPNSRWSSRSRLTTWACTETSSADTGSSHTSTRGRSANARAIPSRCRWPPENWYGRRPACAGSRPTSSISSRALSERSRAPTGSRWMSSGSRTSSSAVIRGSRLPYGSCITIWIPRLRRRRSAAGSFSNSSPSSHTWPAVGRSSDISSRTSVDLPQPDSPTRPSVERSESVRSTPSTALTSGARRPNRSPRAGKCLTRPRASSSGGPRRRLRTCPRSWQWWRLRWQPCSRSQARGASSG